jgi:hypothetical protein
LIVRLLLVAGAAVVGLVVAGPLGLFVGVVAALGAVWLVWLARGRPQPTPEAGARAAHRIVLAIQVCGVLLTVGGSAVLFVGIPLVLFGQHDVRRLVAVPASIAIGLVLGGLAILGVRRGWITLDD